MGIKIKICILWAILWTFCVTFTNAQETSSTTTLEPNRIAAANSNANNQYAWNRADKYVPPDFEGYFAKEDLAAATRLDDFMIDQKLRERSPNELLNVVRRGLRSTKQSKSKVLEMVGKTFIWNKSPQNPEAIELIYHASGSTDPGIVYSAMYYGLAHIVDRSDNLIV